MSEIMRFNPQIVRTPISCEAEAAMEFEFDGEYVEYKAHEAAIKRLGGERDEALKQVESLKSDNRTQKMSIRETHEYHEMFCDEAGIPKCDLHDSWCYPHVYAWILERVKGCATLDADLLAERKRVEELDWKLISSDSMPKVGDELLRLYESLWPELTTVVEVDSCENYLLHGWNHYRPINLPRAAKELNAPQEKP